jgi:hypothetical protein
MKDPSPAIVRPIVGGLGVRAYGGGLPQMRQLRVNGVGGIEANAAEDDISPVGMIGHRCWSL